MKIDGYPIYLTLLGIGILILGIALARYLRKRKLKETMETSSESLSSEAPETTAKKLETKPKRPLSKAITNWIPLLREKTKDGDRWEEALILSDMGPSLADELISGLQKTDREPFVYFTSELKKILQPAKAESEPWKLHKPWVLYLVGVNGVGKTTTVVKLARFFRSQNYEVGVVGADTFRKAAIEQLERACVSNSVDFFSYKLSGDQTEGADPSAVLYDGLQKFKTKDIILVDTSGRLHTKKNLMEELKKMKRVGNKAMASAPHDIWLVIDATLGQNALTQAKVFHDSVQLTGLILTKMDGLSRGGSVFQLYRELQLPIRFLGKGESSADLERFDPENFVEELFDLEAS